MHPAQTTIANPVRGDLQMQYIGTVTQLCYMLGRTRFRYEGIQRCDGFVNGGAIQHHHDGGLITGSKASLPIPGVSSHEGIGVRSAAFENQQVIP